MTLDKQPNMHLHGHLYTAFFCEENIWHLANALTGSPADSTSLEVLFISNPLQQAALRAQRAGPVDGYMVWDYHVILMDRLAGVIYDFDSRISFPCEIDSYLEQTLPVPGEVMADYQPLFRSVPARSFLRRFSSDRSHMIGVLPPEQFPEWPQIHPQAAVDGVTLNQYRNLTLALAETCIFDTKGLLGFVHSAPQSLE